VNNRRLPRYARLDAALGYRFQWLAAQWRVKLSVYNVTNRRNIVRRRYVPEEDNVRVDDRRGLPVLPLIELEVAL
jgi:outer membrane receptor protein involved in Fe transport